MARKELNHRKDESLDRLASLINVAQFVSFSPAGMSQEYSRVLGFEPNHKFGSLAEAVTSLMERSPEESLNVRSFAPSDPRSHEFIYGIRRSADVCDAIKRISASGLFVIVNETVDVSDGGVSGVYQGGVIEFAPDDTPRCVEKPGVAALPSTWGIELLETVYQIPITFGIGGASRLEFSVHPRTRGWKDTHILGWELEQLERPPTIEARVRWPNRFSRMIGDKAFGLLVAAHLGLPVPYTTVLSRRVAPFSFGLKTDSFEWWIRTCPTEQVPGKFTTKHGWSDPFKIMAEEDPDGTQIASVIAQAAVPSKYSGALIVGEGERIFIEGVRGEGERMMKGSVLPEDIPPNVRRAVEDLYESVRAKLGPVRFEWVFDGQKAWLVQLHCGATSSDRETVVPGRASSWRRFDVALGLEALRVALAELQPGEGIELVGRFGLTSHVADVVRRAGHPARVWNGEQPGLFESS
jgi:hypothetical protein